MNMESIPNELKDVSNWVLWKLEERDGKNTKIPYQTNGKRADSTNPDTWNRFEFVEQALIRRKNQFSGIGFVFSEDTGIIGIDWDKVRDPETGEWDEEILEEIKSLNSYAELSQSGTGAHVLIKGKIPGTRRRKDNIEMYSKERFFVVTGSHIKTTPSAIKENQEAISKLYKKRFGEETKEEKKSPATAKEPEKKRRSPKMSDEEVLEHCRRASNSEKFIKLYDKGEWREFNYPSQSEADYALCFIMAFYTEDEKQLDRLFRKGALYREDWDRTSKYTLDNVLNQITEVYNPEKKGKAKSDGNILSSRGREVLKLAFKKMLEADSDQARQRNGEGFNKFDSEAIHEDMDGKEEVPDNVLIKHAHRLKKYKKQLTEYGIDVNEMEDIVKEAKEKQKSAEAQKVTVHFDEVAEKILTDNHIFSMRDNGQIYLYIDGVYRSEGTEAIIGTQIRDAYNLMFVEKWKEINSDFDLPKHIPQATVRYVNEVIAYIRAYTHIPREIIDTFQETYINFKNCLFNLDKWEFEEHTHGIKTICQIPVSYDKKAECPQITNFLNDVAKPEDIAFLEEWAGYCLTTDVSYQKALMLYGIPGTGKSVFATMLETFIGGENASSESLQKIEEDKYRAAKLYGKRVNICSDIPSTKMHKTEVFKKLVSGLDTIDAENKYQDPFKFKNKAKLTFSANKIPEGPKDPAFYERFCLIEFGNKFRGTDKDDKKLIQKLTTDTELSGFLNVALEGLKRLYENDKFSYNKTFEETEREYILNSNPVAFFMDKCTVISDQDIESTLLYLSYVDWSTKNNKPRVSNIEFSRRLNKMGYTSHRENLKSDGSKKATFWDNLRLKTPEEINKDDEKKNTKNDLGQDLGQDQNNRSCPKISCLQITKESQENVYGQDLFPCVDFVTKNNQKKSENIETVTAAQNGETENTHNELKTSCPSVCFFNSGKYGQDVLEHPVLDPVREQKTLILCQEEDDNSINNHSNCELLRTDLKNYARSHYNLIVENIPVFVGEFNNKYPGYKQRLGLQAVLSNAERLSARGWK